MDFNKFYKEYNNNINSNNSKRNDIDELYTKKVTKKKVIDFFNQYIEMMIKNKEDEFNKKTNI